MERDIAHALARTPYPLVPSVPRINIFSAAGEMGPFANARAITGRIGLYLRKPPYSPIGFV
jgi:hypothetical protein